MENLTTLLTILLVLIAIRKPFWGLISYLVLAGFVGLSTFISSTPFAPLLTIAAGVNQFIILALAVRGTLQFKRKWKLPRHVVALIGYTIVFSIWSLLSILWTANIDKSSEELSRLIKFLFFVYAIYANINSIKHYKIFLIINLVIFFISDIIQVIVFLIGNERFIFGGGVALISVAILQLMKKKDVKSKIIYSFILLIVFSSYMLSTTRRGFGMVIIAILITVVFHFSRRIFIYSIIVAAIMSLSIQLFATDYFYYRIWSIKNLGKTESTWSGRDKLWAVGWEMVKESPIIGLGYGVNTDLMPEYSKKAGYTKGGRMHNTYLKVLSELGLVGFVLLMGIFFSIMRTLYINTQMFKSRGNWTMYVLTFAMFASWVALLGAAFFGWSGYLDKGLWSQAAIALVGSKVLSLSRVDTNSIRRY